MLFKIVLSIHVTNPELFCRTLLVKLSELDKLWERQGTFILESCSFNCFIFSALILIILRNPYINKQHSKVH